MVSSGLARKKPILIRPVYTYNLESEFRKIQGVIRRYPYVSMDTEFPGTVYRHVPGTSTPFQERSALLYHFMRKNVNALKLIQVGLTFSDADGNLPDLGTPCCYIWEFNFRDFDLSRDLHVPESIQLLKKNGIDFSRNSLNGIDSARFAQLMMESGLVFNGSLTWVTFHGAYDFGFLIKILNGQELPRDLSVFLKLMKLYFGNKIYDVKHLMIFCNGLFGGLERLANEMDVEREVGNCHQAGSDSLLTWRTFRKLKERFFVSGTEKYSGVLYGL